MVEVMLGFFPLKGNPLLWWIVLRLCIEIVNIVFWERRLWEKEEKLHQVCCRLYPFNCWIIIKEGPRNFSGGCIPHSVNQVDLCLYCILYIFCFILLLHGLAFITTGIREKVTRRKKGSWFEWEQCRKMESLGLRNLKSKTTSDGRCRWKIIYIRRIYFYHWVE